MLIRVDFLKEGLVAFVSMERCNAIVITDVWHRAGLIHGRVVRAVRFTVVGIVGVHPWRVSASQVDYPLSVSWEDRALEANDRCLMSSKTKRKAQRKAKRVLARANSRENRIGDNIVNTLKTVFIRQLLETQ